MALKTNEAEEKELSEVDWWKYVVLLVFSCILIFDFLPAICFGILYGRLLSEIGNEAEDTSTIVSIFFMSILLAGIPGSQIIKRTSSRAAAIAGAIAVCVGSFLSVFVRSTYQLLFVFSIMQGVGFGMLIVTASSELFKYFNTKQSFYTNVGYLITGIVMIASPSLSILLVNLYGVRGTLLLLCGLNLQMIPAALCFHPIKWHIKRKNAFPLQVKTVEKTKNVESIDESNNLEKILELRPENESNEKVCCSWNLKNWCTSVYKTLDLSLLKDPVFINASMGVSLVRNSGVLYVSYLPLILKTVGFTMTDISIFMTVFVVSDFIGRVALCALTGFTNVKTRQLIFFGGVIMCIFRAAQIFKYNFVWTVMECGALGFVKSFIDNTTFVMYSEMFPQQFLSAVSLGMTLSAVVFVFLGQFLKIVISATGSVISILIILSVVAGCSMFAWVFEFIFKYVKTRTATTYISTTLT